MPLQSRLFANDPKLEAAAVSDPAHILLGAKGDHVKKIQLALIELDGAAIKPDGAYGPATAKAVLEYKRKRGIINRNYQTTADNIVGKMTMAALDEEFHRLETQKGPIALRVLAPAAEHLKHRPQVTATPKGGGLMLSFAISPSLVAAPTFNPGPLVTINKGQTALIEVKNGQGALVIEGDPKIATVRDPQSKSSISRISSDPQIVEVVGHHRGGAVFFFIFRARTSPFSLPRNESVSLTVSVNEYRATPYVPTMDPPHNHQPTRRWKELLGAIQQPTDSTSGKALWALCAARADPETFVDAAIQGEFGNKPVALKHLNWYLRDGRGAELNEDDNIEKWVRTDAMIQGKIYAQIVRNMTKGTSYSIDFPVGSTEFGIDDYYYSFGAIDRLDVQVDWIAKTVKVFFKDIYEWHPVCPGFYTQFKDDTVRVTNSLHAALVELKLKGAADYWMVGEATVPMSVFGFPP